LLVVVKVRYFLHRASLNFEAAEEGAKTEKKAEKVSVGLAEDDEERRVYTEVTNKLRSKCIVDARFISYIGPWERSEHARRTR